MNSPVYLQTKPPTVRSGYVHLLSLRTSHLYVFAPAEIKGKMSPNCKHYIATVQMFIDRCSQAIKLSRDGGSIHIYCYLAFPYCKYYSNLYIIHHIFIMS